MTLTQPRWSIRIWLLLLVMAFAVPVGLLLVRYLVLVEVEAQKLAYTQVRAQADATAGRLALVLHDYEDMLSRVALEFRGNPPVQSRNFVAQQFMDLHPEIANLGVFDLHANRVYTHLPQALPVAMAQPFPWMQRALKSESFEVGDAFLGSLTNQWVVMLSYPVYGVDGKRSGFVEAAVNLLALNERVMSDVPVGTTVMVFDHHEQLLLRSLELESGLGSSGSNAARHAAQGQREGYTRTVHTDGVMHLFAYGALPGTAWRVVAGVPESDAMAPYYVRRNQGLMLAGASLVLMLILAWRIGLVIANPIRALAHVADRVAQGDGDARMALRGPSEVQAVARQFNHMLDTRLEAEKALRESDARWRFALEGAGDGVWDWDIAGGGAFFSRRFRAMLGHADCDHHGSLNDWSELVHPEDLPGVWVTLRQHLDGQTRTYVKDYRMRCQDGSYKWILARGLIIERDAHGKPLRMVGTNADLSERKQMELALQASRDDMEATLQAMPDLLFEMALDGRYMDYKTVDSDLLAASPAELVGKLVTEVLPPSAAATCLAALQQANEVGVSRGMQYELELPVGRRWFELSVARKAPVQGQCARFIVVARDITERQREHAQKKAQALALRDSLVREVHHRIKNNLQGIVGLLRESARRHPDTQEPISRAVGQVQSIALIHGLQGRASMDRVRLCELTQAVASGVASLREMEINVDIPDVWSGYVIAEQESVPIALVFNELILNAVKHGDSGQEGGVKVLVRKEEAPWDVSVCIVNAGHWQPGDTGTHMGMQLVENLLPRQGAKLLREIHSGCIFTTLRLGSPVVVPDLEKPL